MSAGGDVVYRLEANVLILRWQCRNQGVVSAGVAELGCAPRGAEFVEEFDIGLVIFGPLLRSVILVIDGFDWADGFAGAAVDTLVRLNVQRPLTRRRLRSRADPW